MDASLRNLSWTTRQFAVLLAVLMAVAVLAGGAGGYLIRGSSTLVVTRTTPAGPVRQQVVFGPLTEPHDAIPTQGPIRDSQSGYRDSSQRTAGYNGLNGDSASGY